jgi:hypothetical protein
MNELHAKKKEFEDSIRETEKQIAELKRKADFDKKHLKLIKEQIALQDADKPEAKTLGKEQASGNKI